MKQTAPTIRRRAVFGLLAVPVLATFGRANAANGDPIYIGISGAYTGADSANSIATRNGAMMAIQEANDRGGIAGLKIATVELNEATANAGQYDPAQAAANAREFRPAGKPIYFRTLTTDDHRGPGMARFLIKYSAHEPLTCSMTPAVTVWV